MDIFKAASLYQNHSIILNALWMFYILIALFTVKFAIESKSILHSRGIFFCLLLGFLLFASVNGAAIYMAEKFREILWREIFDAGMNLQMQGESSALLSTRLSTAIQELDYFNPRKTAFVHGFLDLCILSILGLIYRFRQNLVS